MCFVCKIFQVKLDLEEQKQKHGEIKNPKLEFVAKLLREKACVKEGDQQIAKGGEKAGVKEGAQQIAKGMLFTKTRENTKALKAWLDENPDLSFIRAERLVGTGKGEGQ